ncbi:MAG: polymerase subunit alpha [Flavipsychrobacter sp.]|nr:polymerase subunit alpha [Flavipsychrobacter sp.]
MAVNNKPIDRFLIPQERAANGDYIDIEDFIKRTHVLLEQLIILVRIGSFRFTGKNKKALLWEAHVLLNKNSKWALPVLFKSSAKKFTLPVFQTDPLEDGYDEVELLGFPVTISMFDLVKTDYRGESNARDLITHLGKSIRMVGDFVTAKYVPTSRGLMAFGSFLDTEGRFFDTTNFPQSFRQYQFKGKGVYLISGKVVEEFGFPSIEVDKMAKLPIKNDPRSV